MLLVLVEEIVEDLLVQEGDSFEIVATARFETHDLIDQPVRLVGQVRDVLLPLHLLLHIGRVVTNLQLDSV